MPRARILRRTTVFGVYDGGTYGAVERVGDHLAEPPAGMPRQRYWKIFAARSVLAAGALERPIIFGGNDRPGVMLASAVRTYVNRFGVAPGSRAVIFTTSDDGWKTVAELGRAGIHVAAVVDARTVMPSLASRHEAEQTFIGGAVVGTAGSKSLRRVEVRTATGEMLRIDADLLCVSGGWNPSLALSTHLGARPEWSAAISAFVPGQTPDGMVVVGAAGGTFSLASILREGAHHGHAAAVAAGYQASSPDELSVGDEDVSVSPLWHVAQSRGKAFVDFQHDVTREDIGLAAREGFRSVELLKRYTTLGMATDQGKTSNITGHAILAETLSRSIPEVGTTVSRPPFTPVALGAIAGIHTGRNLQPTRHTAAHEWARERGAKFTEAGQWLRAQWFGEADETSWIETVSKEVRAVRSGVGICDVSTLGKIDVQGADAAAFLNRVYTNTFSTLPVGKTRYGVMLREDGFVLDDGTTARLGEDRFIMSTTSANAARVMQHLEYARQVIWPELDVNLVSVTEQWSQYAVAGPRSRELLAALLGDSIDLSDAAFPYLACAEFNWNGIPTRLFRISFSGELAYELAVPASIGAATARAMMDHGEMLGVVAYGTEAMTVMRIEKGHVAGGELNGMITARDLRLDKLMSGKKDFIGAVLAKRPALSDAERPTLAGFRPVNSGDRLQAGAHFLDIGAATDLTSDLGYMTSVAYSPNVGSWIGLGFIRSGRTRLGERVRAYDAVRGTDTEVEICDPVFLDREGVRLHG